MNTDIAEEQKKINVILRILEEHYPHSVSGVEIASLLNLSVEKVESFLGFLAKYSFISYDKKGKMAIISADFSSLSE